jgi:predicted nuclease of predicted toxin-antitoxin system
VSADAGFVELARRCGPPPKVIHLQRCDFPLRVIENLLRRHAIRIAEFEQSPSSAVLILGAP